MDNFWSSKHLHCKGLLIFICHCLYGFLLCCVFSVHKVNNLFKCLDFLLQGLDIHGIVKDAEQDVGKVSMMAIQGSFRVFF